MKEEGLPPPRFAVLLASPRVTTVDEDGNGEVEYREHNWHRNHRLYEYEAQATNYMKKSRRSNTSKPASEMGRVIIVDPALCEPAGLTSEESFMFAERMATYWADEMARRQKAVSVDGAARPRPKRSAGVTTYGTKKRKRRARRTANAPASPMVQAAIAGVAGALIGNVLSRAFAPITPPTPPSPPSPPNTTMAPFSPFSPFSPFKPDDQ